MAIYAGHLMGPSLTHRHPAGVSAFVYSFIGDAEDDYGNVTETWSASFAELQGCAFDPGSSSEPRLQGHDRVIVEPTLYIPFEADVKPRDRVRVEGVTYEVEGQPRRWRSPFTGRTPGAVVTLRLVEG